MMNELGKPMPYSLLTSVYGVWEEYKVPSTFYHYLLTILPHLPKKQQNQIISRQVKVLKADNYPYHRIITAIQSRQNSLHVIEKNIHITKKFKNTNRLEWQQPQQYSQQVEQHQQGQSSPLLSQRRQNQHSLIELVNHIRIYQRVTLQIIYLIAQWMQELKQLGYNGLIQFQHQKQNYLSKINTDTQHITSAYSYLFQNNPFFLMKITHEQSQYALIFGKIKPNEQLVKRIHECLNIISNYHAEVLRSRILAKNNQQLNKKDILKITDVHRKYMSYDGNEEIINNLSSPVKSKANLEALRKSTHKLRKSDIILNPEPIIHKIQRKHPSMNLVHHHNEIALSEDGLLKRSNTEQHLLKKKNSQIMRPIYAKESTSIDIDFDSAKNQKFGIKKDLQIGNQFNEDIIPQQEIKQSFSIPEIMNKKPILKVKEEEEPFQREFEQKIQRLNEEQLQHKFQEKIQRYEKKQQMAELAEDNQIKLLFDENVRQSELIKYLRSRAFNKSQVSFDQLQNLAKEILQDKDNITFVRVESRGLPVAWLAVNFIQKDTIMRSVHILYLKKFVKLSNFQRKLLDSFVLHGYGIIRNSQKILYQVDLLDTISRCLVKVKYKVNPSIQKNEIKKIMKKNKCISQSRILKYHSYSKNTKYHTYCQHEKGNCMIGYNFIEAMKITIDKNPFIKAKADRITQIGSEMYKIQCIINDTDLIISRNLAQILQLEKQTEVEKDSSFDSRHETQYTHIALRQGKLMRKYMNEHDEIIISEFITVYGHIPEVRSIGMSRNHIPPTLLLLEAPFYVAITTRDQNQAKTLAIMQFQ